MPAEVTMALRVQVVTIAGKNLVPESSATSYNAVRWSIDARCGLRAPDPAA